MREGFTWWTFRIFFKFFSARGGEGGVRGDTEGGGSVSYCKSQEGGAPRREGGGGEGAGRASAGNLGGEAKFFFGVEMPPKGKVNQGISHFLLERSWLCRGHFREYSLYVLLIGQEREKGRIGKIPEEVGKILEESGKYQKLSLDEKDKKDKKGRTSPDRNPPLFETPKDTNWAAVKGGA